MSATGKATSLRILSFARPHMRAFHLSWFAFFLCFFGWFGIAAELEAEMEHVVGTYRCEWRAAIEDERIRRRFATFVNSDEEDDTLLYVRERGQRRPAYASER